MKTRKVFASFVTVIFLTASMPLSAQTLEVLHTFSAPSPNTDGIYPLTDMTLSNGVLYGAASGGGTNSLGTVFSINTDGSDFTVIHTFQGTNVDNIDGARPMGSLILSGETLYGTASSGGASNNGTIFCVNTDGSGFTVLYTFLLGNGALTNVAGADPNSLVLSPEGVLYGTAKSGGTNGYGTLFMVSTNGTNFTVLHTFRESSKVHDGENPQSTLVLANDTLYGMTAAGGTNGTGTIYSINTNGDNFGVIYSFPNNGATIDGTFLNGLLVSGNSLFGANVTGGTNETGLIFSINTDGSGFTPLHTFPETGLDITNTDGAHPEGELVLAGNTLYGTAESGGSNNWGTIFSVNTDGSGFNTLYTFPKLSLATNYDGVEPQTGLVFGGGTFFGTAYAGGNAYGTVYGLPILPTISNVNPAGSNLVLSGTSGIAGENCVVLESASLTLPYNEWTPIITNTLASGGNFSLTITNAVNTTLSQQYYILQMQ